MGQEISKIDFTKEEYEEFQKRLREETKILKRWFEEDRFEPKDGEACTFGAEVEGWLIDKDHIPAPENEKFINNLNDPLVVLELAQFNFELNCEPYKLGGSGLRDMHKELMERWEKCAVTAKKMGLDVCSIGILPTVRDDMLDLKYLSNSNRYTSLNNKVMERRENEPVHLNISGHEHLKVDHKDVMLEAAATSMQIHLQVSLKESVRFYNSSIILSAPIVAMAGNSPYMFGKELWSETRIPVFEQAVSNKAFRDRTGRMMERVGFGTGYARKSLMEAFLENLDGYEVLLPLLMDEEPEQLAHLRLHNGTVWRWNRPLIGVNKKGVPHLRLEHRSPAAGPTIVDNMADIAFYLGSVHSLAKQESIPEDTLSFESSRKNFYEAAKYGLDANIEWIDGKTWNLQKLILDELIPSAYKGLISLGFNEKDCQYYLEEVLHRRVLSGQNGASWQKAFIQTHGACFQEMTEEYLKWQSKQIPVSEWTV